MDLRAFHHKRLLELYECQQKLWPSTQTQMSSDHQRVSRFEWPPCTTLAPVPSVHPARILWQSFLSDRPPSESSSDRWLLGCIKHRRVSRSVRRPVYSLLPSADSVEVHQLQLGHLLFCTSDAVDYDSVDQWDSSYMYVLVVTICYFSLECFWLMGGQGEPG